MLQQRSPIPQTETPLPPKQTLPTMYDLPSENPEEPGLPDEFHSWQPQLLSRTLRLPDYPSDRIFVGSDLNLYYDVHHFLWHKRPDWFLVVDVSRLYEETDLRSSYVVWQEGTNPFLVVELLSPGTEKEDLGQFVEAEVDAIEESSGQATREIPPRKWDVYERILRVPYYAVFSRYSDRLRIFKLNGGRYQEQILDVDNPRFWIPELKLGLGVWQGEFEGINRRWLRWYDGVGNWVSTDAEFAIAQAELERQKRLELAEKLKSLSLEQLTILGISPSDLE
ncbi:Uma2 family endonuclease [Kamptonema animale CS-326]|jgi:Uma2 family endonuclease|uniref:Uma2 family endonuclease n=1 Tax=Kamptonema animale TaxID=92934 RepID=UPI00232B0BEF|nr:Uma2 family endonuclease [Kamptonema animale]MDB9512563.1 Uma2 family endonuclease [Kamptonema animale CS-326]